MSRYVKLSFALVLFAGAGCSKPVIVLRDVPGDLRLPLPEGSNKLLTVVVKGEAVQSVWLARRDADAARVPMNKADDDTYQVNLAAEEVLSLLDPDRASGELCIVAEFGGGRRISSLPIRYSVESASGKPPTRHLLAANGEDCKTDGSWYVPEQVDQIELRFERTSYGTSASATAESETWPFDRRKFRTLSLKLSPQQRERWKESGELKIAYCVSGRDPEPLGSLKAVPGKLALHGDSRSFTVYQRESATIPATHGYLRISLGDITAGRVLVSIHTDDGHTLVARTPLRPSEAVTFALTEERGVVVLDKLVNLLTSKDYATFRITTPSAWERSRIDRLLAALEGSDVTLICEQQEYSGPQAASHLREKLGAMESPAMTLDEFIDQVAGRSSTTGEAYQVRRSDGTTVEAATWLRQLLREPRDAGVGQSPGEP